MTALIVTSNDVCGCDECHNMMAFVYDNRSKAHNPDRFDRKDLDDFTCSICTWIAADAVQV